MVYAASARVWKKVASNGPGVFRGATHLAVGILDDAFVDPLLQYLEVRGTSRLCQE